MQDNPRAQPENALITNAKRMLNSWRTTGELSEDWDWVGDGEHKSE